MMPPDTAHPNQPPPAPVIIRSAEHAAAATAALDRVIAAQNAWTAAHTMDPLGKPAGVAWRTLDQAMRLYAGVRDMTATAAAAPAAAQAPAQAAGNAGANRNSGAGAGAGANRNAGGNAGGNRGRQPQRQRQRQRQQDDADGDGDGDTLCQTCLTVSVQAPFRICYACKQYPDRIAGECIDCGKQAKPEFARCWHCSRQVA